MSPSARFSRSPRRPCGSSRRPTWRRARRSAGRAAFDARWCWLCYGFDEDARFPTLQKRSSSSFEVGRRSQVDTAFVDNFVESDAVLYMILKKEGSESWEEIDVAEAQKPAA